MSTVRFGSYVEKKDRKAGNLGDRLPLLSVSQYRGVLRFNELHDKPPRAEDFSAYKIVEPNDIVFNKMSIRSGALGTVSERGVVTYHYEVLEPTAGTVPAFVSYLMKSAWFTSELVKRERGIGAGGAAGVRTTEVPFTVLKTVPVPLLLPREQARIVDYLDQETAEIDAFIADLKSLVSLQAEQAAAILENLIWPAGSSDIPLRRIVRSVDQGHSPEADSSPAGPGGVGLLKAGCTNFGVFNVAANKSLAHMGSLENFKFVERGDLIVTRASGSLQHVGSAAVVPELDRKLAMSDKHYRIRTTSEYSSDYLALVMMTEKFKTTLRPEVSGAQGLARNVSLASLKSMKVPNVSVGAQIRNLGSIRSVQDDARSAETQAKQAIALANERRVSLISAAVTGQIDLTQRHRPVAEQLEEEVLQKA